MASATLDTWADPRGEFLATKYANPVYALFGKANVGVEDWPPAESPVGDFLGYHLRTGKHDITEYDWRQYLAFADRHFKFQGVKPDVLPPSNAVKLKIERAGLATLRVIGCHWWLAHQCLRRRSEHWWASHQWHPGATPCSRCGNVTCRSVSPSSR
ncbi:MAG: hypothetical protein QM775_19190 [Pirellulales bacterium]